MADYFDNINLLKTAVKWKKHLLIITIGAMVLSGIFSSAWFIKPKYKSTAILYPANIIEFGNETPTEQMIQIFRSDDIKLQIAKEFKLFESYGIDTLKFKAYKTTFLKEFDDNVIIDKTELVSVRLDVLDYDAVKARDMVDRMIALFNKKERELQKLKSIELAKILKVQLDKKKIEMDSMDFAIREIRMKYGILDYALQTEYATEGALISSPLQKANEAEVNQLLKNLEEKGGEFVSLNEHIWRIRGTYNDLKVQYENALRDVEKDLTYCNVVTSAFVADKKSYPVRWLIVAVSTASALLFTLLLISVMENAKNFKVTEEA